MYTFRISFLIDTENTGIHFVNSADGKKMPLIKFVFNGHKFATWQPSSTDGPNRANCIFFIIAEIKINSNL